MAVFFLLTKNFLSGYRYVKWRQDADKKGEDPVAIMGEDGSARCIEEDKTCYYSYLGAIGCGPLTRRASKVISWCIWPPATRCTKYFPRAFGVGVQENQLSGGVSKKEMAVTWPKARRH